MALLKNSVDQTLSLHAEMFPRLQSDVNRMVRQVVEATRLYSEDSTLETVQDAIVGSFTADSGTYANWLGKGYSFLSVDDLKKAKQIIHDAESDSKKRNGAAELVKCLQHIDTAKESLVKNYERIKEILNPKPVERRTMEQIKNDAEVETKKATVVALTASFANLPESVLRTMAQVFLGDNQIDYTKEELPRVIAVQQVVGAILEPGL